MKTYRKSKSIIILLAVLCLACAPLSACRKSEKPAETTQAVINSGETLFGFYESILSQIDPMAQEIANAYEEATGREYPVSYSAFSLACVDVYSFSEGVDVEFVKGIFDSFYDDLTVRETGRNEYTFTYTGTDPYTEEKYKGSEVIKFDPEGLRMSCVFYRNDEYYSFSELVCTGTDTYAGITPENRILIKCDGTEVTEFWYVENRIETNPEYNYLNDYDDSIYDRKGLDESWIEEDGIDYGIYRLSHCTPDTLTITGQTRETDQESEEIIYYPGYKWTYTKRPDSQE